MFLTELSNICIPFLLGKSIDGLLVGNWTFVFLLGLTFLVSNLFNYKRMVYDTKVYSKIYNDIVFKFLKNENVDLSAKIARTDMAYQIVYILEGYVHYYISTIVTLVGTIGFIYSENWIVGIVVSLCLFFIIISSRLFYKKIKQSVLLQNDHYEKKMEAIKQGYKESFSFFNRRRRLDIYASNIQGKHWLSVGIIKNLFLLLSIVLLVLTDDNITIGSVVMSFSYVENFLIALLSVPVAIEMYSRMLDILKRLEI